MLVFFKNFVTSGSNLTVQHSAAYFFDYEFSTVMSSIYSVKVNKEIKK